MGGWVEKTKGFIKPGFSRRDGRMGGQRVRVRGE
jgi:hypothetical protein